MQADYTVTDTATCEEAGTKTYSATVTFGEKNYTGSKEESSPAMGHEWGAYSVTTEATCENAGVETSVCAHDSSHTRTREIAALGHEWGEPNWSFDKTSGKATATCTCTHDNTHTEQVQADYTVTDTATCEAAGTKTYSATVSLDGKNYSGSKEEDSPALGHEWGAYSVTTEATCENTGVETSVCAHDSSHTRTREIAAIGHAYGEPTWSWNDSTKQATAIFTCVHDSSHKMQEQAEFTVTDTATCEKAGKKTYNATVSFAGKSYDGSKTEDSAALGHEWGEYSVTKKATCESAGEETSVCKRDSSHVNTREIALLGHEWGEYSVTKKATCESAGEETSVCKRDSSHVNTREIAPLGHEWGEYSVTTEATCESTGVETSVCAHDSSHVRTREIAALGHDWNAGIVTKQATCTEEGIRTYTCTRDAGHTMTEVIDTVPHRYTNVWSKDASAHWHYCTVCGAIADREAHHSAASATEESEELCEVCGYVMASKLPLTSHVFFKNTGNLRLQDLTFVKETENTYQVTLPQEAPVNEEYYFEGWNSSEDEEIHQPGATFSYTFEAHKNVTFSAIWTKLLGIGTYDLESDTRYHLAEGSYRLEGDDTVYAGNQTVYLAENGKYTLKEGR